jgi:hypothetical protein
MPNQSAKIKRSVDRLFHQTKKERHNVPIEIHAHTSNFTIIGNACFNDERLNFEALAIFTYLRSSRRASNASRRRALCRRPTSQHARTRGVADGDGSPVIGG